MIRISPKIGTAIILLGGAALIALYLSDEAQTQDVPQYVFDPTWPKPLPNNWKMGGVTGLAVDSNDNVWVLNRPNDLTSIG